MATLSMRPNSVVVILLLAQSLFCAQANAEIAFDKLTECDDIESLIKSLSSSPMPSAGQCRDPSGPLEKSMAYRSGGDDAQLCFLRTSPKHFLNGFSCVRIPVTKGGALVCFRPADVGDIDRYKSEFTVNSDLARRANDYKVAASKCKASNGNTTVAAPITIAPVLATVAKMEFGFGTRVGTGRMPGSAIQHGYAKTDPMISKNPPAAIEFISVVAGGTVGKISNQKGETLNAGSWLLHVEDEHQLSATAKKKLKIPNTPAEFRIRTYSFERREGAKQPSIGQEEFLEKIQTRISKKLVTEKFKAITDAQMRKSTGVDGKEAIQRSTEGVPFGLRHLMTRQVAGKMVTLYNETRPACAEDGSGAIGVSITPKLGVPDVEPDYGSMFVSIMALGSCSRLSRTSTSEYIAGIEELIQDSVSTEIAKW